MTTAPSPVDPGELTAILTRIIAETNGISLADTVELASESALAEYDDQIPKCFRDFRQKLGLFQMRQCDLETLLSHPVSESLFAFLKAFPIPFRDEHIHLSGSLTGDFVFPRLQKLLQGPNSKIYEEKIRTVFGKQSLPLRSAKFVDHLMRLGDQERFDRYLQILLLPKLVLFDREAHSEASYHLAQNLYEKYNVGFLRLKFSLSRQTTNSQEAIPGLGKLTSEDVVLGLCEGFLAYKKQNPSFNFVLSPCFRKEAEFFDAENFASKGAFFLHQVRTLLHLRESHSQLADTLTDVDTVGNEKHLFRKVHFNQMRMGFRLLHQAGFRIRSHHGENWLTLRRGVQAVDNALNIWNIDGLEHGLSLGVNPNYYFQMLFERIAKNNHAGKPLAEHTLDYRELAEFNWEGRDYILRKILSGEKMSHDDLINFLQIKYEMATEVEHYQHDSLNHLIGKRVSLTALPSSNHKLTSVFPDSRTHPFSWWEKKGIRLGVGTDNYVTLGTDFIREMLILLFTDPLDLKILKLLMIVTGEYRRPFLSHLLWRMRDTFERKKS